MLLEGIAGVSAGLGFIIATRLAEESNAQTAENGIIFVTSQSWLNERGRLFVSGLQTFQPGPASVLLATPRTDADVLWALEEALRSQAIRLAIGAVENASLLATRRLDWAARAAGASMLLLRTRPARDLSAARRRWRIASYPSGRHPWDVNASGAPRWRVILERSRDGSAGEWILEHERETHRLRVVARLAGDGLDVGQKPENRSPFRRLA